MNCLPPARANRGAGGLDQKPSPNAGGTTFYLLRLTYPLSAFLCSLNFRERAECRHGLHGRAPAPKAREVPGSIPGSASAE